MPWMSVRVWMSSIPRTGTAALDGTLLLVLLMPSAVMMAIAETGAQLARNVTEKAAARLGRGPARRLIGRTGCATIRSPSTRLVSARHLWCTVISPVRAT